MIAKAALIISLAMSLADGCGAGSSPGSDKGGDNNPSTGECEVTFSETVGGKFHKYPELVEGTDFVYGKVLVTCAIAPKTHRIELHLQTRKPGAGTDWRQRQFGEQQYPEPEGLRHRASQLRRRHRRPLAPLRPHHRQWCHRGWRAAE